MILGVTRQVTYLTDPEGTTPKVYRSEARPKSHYGVGPRKTPLGD